MFGHKKHSHILWFLAGLMLIVVFVLLFFVLPAVYQKAARFFERSAPHVQSVVEQSPAAVIAQYQKDLERLSDSINHLSDAEQQQEVEEALLAMRVPQAFLEQHLSFFLSVRAAKETPDAAHLDAAQRAYTAVLAAVKSATP